MKKILDFLIAVLSAIIAYLAAIAQVDVYTCSIWPFKQNSGIINFIIEHQVAFFTVFTILIILFYAIRLYKERSETELYFEKLFQHIVDKELGGKVYETRVSLYVKKRGFYLLPKFLWCALCKIFKFQYFINLIYNIPNPFKNYLCLSVRHTYPKKESSITFFRITEEGEKENGIVEKTYKTGKVISIETEFINNIALPFNIDKLNANDKKKVKKYMKDTCIEDYSILKMIKRKSNQFFAFPINKGKQVYGVIIIDKNIENISRSLKDIFSENIDNYQKMIQIAIDSVK